MPAYLTSEGIVRSKLLQFALVAVPHTCFQMGAETRRQDTGTSVVAPVPYGIPLASIVSRQVTHLRISNRTTQIHFISRRTFYTYSAVEVNHNTSCHLPGEMLCIECVKRRSSRTCGMWDWIQLGNYNWETIGHGKYACHNR